MRGNLPQASGAGRGLLRRAALLALTVSAPLVLTVCALTGSSQAQGTRRIAALLYRGQPAGTPRMSDLATIKATGFSAVAWPRELQRAQSVLRELALKAGLEVVIAGGASEPGTARIDTTARSGAVTADAWRALQRGVLTVIFDPVSRDAPRLTDAGGRLLPWVNAARAFSRQLAANPLLFDRMTPVNGVSVDKGPLDVRVSLHQADRAWLLIATNAGPERSRFVARLPPTVPTALWISLLDGSGMSMPRLPDGPHWSADVGAGQALVYLIDRER